MRQAFIGVDVGTSSARAGIFDENGILLATARHPITIWHEAGGVVEQSSLRNLGCMRRCGPRRDGGGGNSAFSSQRSGFDATCSLVVVDAAASRSRSARLAMSDAMSSFGWTIER